MNTYSDRCLIEYEGVKQFTKSKWPNLSYLQMGYDTFDDRHALQLNSCEMIGQNQFQQIKELYVGER